MSERNEFGLIPAGAKLDSWDMDKRFMGYSVARPAAVPTGTAPTHYRVGRILGKCSLRCPIHNTELPCSCSNYSRTFWMWSRPGRLVPAIER